MIRVAINGFGRIGRMVFRAGLDDPEIEFVAVNDLTDIPTLAYLLKYDSVHGKLKKNMDKTENSLIVDGKEIKVFAEKDPANLPWKDLDVDVVVESTGFFLTKETAEKHIDAGAKKVVISAPPKDENFLPMVMGVNEHDYKKDEHNLISNESCTTNCMAPIVKVLNDNYGIKRVFMNTVHAVTSSQRIVDAPDPKDMRRGRSALINMIPTSSGSQKGVAAVVPEVSGKLHTSAVRVPITDGSVIYLIAELERPPKSADDINSLFKNVAEHHMKGVLEYSEEALVSSDIIGNPHSSILDSSRTELDGDIVKIVSWYDNEWGYSCRVVDVVKYCMK